jgi:hypothetical protein
VFWQYSDTGMVAGISGAVDEDRFIGSDGDLVGLTGVPNDAGPPDAPGPTAGGGCGCRSSSPGSPACAFVAALWLARRRRSRAR